MGACLGGGFCYSYIYINGLPAYTLPGFASGHLRFCYAACTVLGSATWVDYHTCLLWIVSLDSLGFTIYTCSAFWFLPACLLPAIYHILGAGCFWVLCRLPAAALACHIWVLCLVLPAACQFLLPVLDTWNFLRLHLPAWVCEFLRFWVWMPPFSACLHWVRRITVHGGTYLRSAHLPATCLPNMGFCSAVSQCHLPAPPACLFISGSGSPACHCLHSAGFFSYRFLDACTYGAWALGFWMPGQVSGWIAPFCVFSACRSGLPPPGTGLPACLPFCLDYRRFAGG